MTSSGGAEGAAATILPHSHKSTEVVGEAPLEHPTEQRLRHVMGELRALRRQGGVASEQVSALETIVRVLEVVEIPGVTRVPGYGKAPAGVNQLPPGDILCRWKNPLKCFRNTMKNPQVACTGLTKIKSIRRQRPKWRTDVVNPMVAAASIVKRGNTVALPSLLKHCNNKTESTTTTTTTTRLTMKQVMKNSWDRWNKRAKSYGKTKKQVSLMRKEGL